NELVRKTDAVRAAEAAGQLIFLPTGDGMALVFTGSVEEPVECALHISRALRAQPSLPVRMGIHSGPVHHVADVNQRANIAIDRRIRRARLQVPRRQVPLLSLPSLREAWLSSRLRT